MKLKDLKLRSSVKEGLDSLTPEEVEKQHKKAEREAKKAIDFRMPDKIESTKATPDVNEQDKEDTINVEPVTESVKDRAELKTLLEKLKSSSKRHVIKRSVKEGYRYDVTYFKENVSNEDNVEETLAKPDGDKVKSYNVALAKAKKENKNIVYGYTTKKNPDKFFEIEPVEYDGDDNAFRKRYGATTIYVAYPNNSYVKEAKEEKREGYSLLGKEDKNIELYSNCYNAEKRAKKLGLKLAEYGDVYGSPHMAYAYWNKSGDRNEDEEVMCYYFFGNDGKPKKTVSTSELEKIADEVGLSSNHIDDADEVIDESLKEGKEEKKELDTKDILKLAKEYIKLALNDKMTKEQRDEFIDNSEFDKDSVKEVLDCFDDLIEEVKNSVCKECDDEDDDFTMNIKDIDSDIADDDVKSEGGLFDFGDEDDYVIDDKEEVIDDTIDDDKKEESCNEDVKIITDIHNFKPWGQAVELWKEIEEKGLIDDLVFLLEDMYPDGMTENELNDLLSYDWQYIRELLHLDDKVEDEEEEDDYE